jgi:hypothetical protein
MINFIKNLFKGKKQEIKKPVYDPNCRRCKGSGWMPAMIIGSMTEYTECYCKK